jgi:hypothetical protein
MWCTRYLAIIRLWRNAWAEFIPFLDYGACCRMRVLVVSVRDGRASMAHGQRVPSGAARSSVFDAAGYA